MEKEEKRRSEDRLVRDARVHGCCRSIHIYGYTYVDACTLPGRCTERPTAMFFDATRGSCTYAELML